MKRRRHFLLLPILASCASFSYAEVNDASLDRYCFGACQLAFRNVHFNDSKPDVSEEKYACMDHLRLVSVYICADVYCSLENTRQGLVGLNRTCSNELPSWESLVGEYTDEKIAKLRRLERDEAGRPTALREVVVPSQRLFELSRDTLGAVSYVGRFHILYGLAMFIFWTAVVAIGVSAKLYAFVAHALEGRKLQQPLSIEEQQSEEIPLIGEPAKTSNRSSVWLRRYITTPATFGYKCAQNVGWCTIPPRIQSLTILAFILVNTAFCIHGYWVFEGNMYFPEVSVQVWRYLSDRTGIISFANFPIIWVFGMRNNVLMWLTGWDFGTYNNFHRWVARVATLQAVIHSVGYTVLVFHDGGWSYFLYWWTLVFWWAGELATIFMCLILCLSVYWMRRHTYEVFLISHIVLSAAILFTMWLHVSIFKGVFDPLVWACCAVWLLDRSLRLLRILAFNPLFWRTKATITYTAESNIVRLRIPCDTSIYQPGPGMYYNLYVLNSAYFWESHPFTMAYSTHRRAAALVDHEHASLLAPQAGEFVSPGDLHSANAMTFLIRPYDGFTSRLRDAALSGKTQLRVLVEGPYGQCEPFDRFGHVLFIVGGSGIVVALTYLRSLCTSPCIKSVRVVWAVRERNFAADVLRNELVSVIESEKLSIDLYLTASGGGRWENGHVSTAVVAGLSVERPKTWRFVDGRPDVREEVDYAVACADDRSLAVVACGPAKMTDDARRAVVDALGKGASRVEYFEESFKW